MESRSSSGSQRRQSVTQLSTLMQAMTFFAGVWSFTAHSFRANGVPVDLSDCPVNGTAILDFKVPAQLDDKDTLLTAVNTIASSIYSNSTFVKENHI